MNCPIISACNKSNKLVNMSFEGKVAVVTGSSSGIGQAVAEQLATKGASVTIHGQNAERLKKTFDLLKKNGISDSRIHCVLGPIEDEKIQKQLIDETVKKFGKLDILVNNAGTANRKDLKPNSLENFDYVINTNLRSVMALTELAIPHLEKTKGNIVNVSSIGAQSTYPDSTPYVVSKAGLDHFTRNSCILHAPKGIRVNTVSPGATETNFLESANLSAQEVKYLSKMVIDDLTPLHRFASPHEVANVIIFLASDLASYVTGSNYVVDGGVLCSPAMSKVSTK